MTVQPLSSTAPTNVFDRLICFGIASFNTELLASPNSIRLLRNAPLLWPFAFKMHYKQREHTIINDLFYARKKH